MSSRPERLTRSAFRVFWPVTTRWMDNDQYGHVNNAVYYAYFDSAVNAHLIEQGLLATGASPAIGLVVETGCTYFESAGFPEPLEVGLAVTRLGRSSARYRVGLFKAGAVVAAAQGHFVHVYVDRVTRRPVDLPEAVRTGLERIAV